MKRFANDLYEKDTERTTKQAMEIYENHLIKQVFEEDNYVMNSDVVDTYLKMQVAAKDYKGAIRTKKTFMEFLRKSALDH